MVRLRDPPSFASAAATTHATGRADAAMRAAGSGASEGSSPAQLGLGLVRRGGGGGGGLRGGLRGGVGFRGGLGLGKGGKRFRKVQKDTIYGVSNGDIRRLARRGGVKRISGLVYDDIRGALKDRLTSILKDAIAVVESSGRSTITVTDIVFLLNRQGRSLYGFDPAFLRSR